MALPTPRISTSVVREPAVAVTSTNSDAVEIITISDDDDDGVGSPPVHRRPRLSCNIKASIEECQQLFAATCLVKLTRCQVPVNAAAPKVTLKEDDGSEDDADCTSSEKQEPPLSVGSAAARCSNNVTKAGVTRSAISRSDAKEIRPSKRPGSNQKQGRKRPYESADCKICGKTLCTKSYVKLHMKKIHTGNRERRHKCEHCERSYGARGTLISHKMENPNGLCKLKDRVKRNRQEKIAKRARELLEQDTTPRGSWKCKICENKIKSSTNYLNHMRSHAGERRFKCDQCGKSFVLRKTLSRHQKLHTGVPEFDCVFCGKEFYQDQNLFSHLRLHTDEKPFFCVVTGCGVSFRHSGSLKMHRRKVHLKKY